MRRRFQTGCYVHEDADGTEHYYYDKENNRKFISEDGVDCNDCKIGLYLFYDGFQRNKENIQCAGNITEIEDKYGNKKIFELNPAGYLYGISEQNAGSTTRKQLITFSNQDNACMHIYGTPGGTDKYSLGYYVGKMTMITHYSRNSVAKSGRIESGSGMMKKITTE